MFAPVRDLGLVVIWDDGDDLHSDEHAPYPHARDVLVQRAYLDNCAAVVAGTAAHRRGRAAGRVRLGARAGRRPGGAALGRAPGAGARATTSSWPATPPPARPGCRRWRTRPPAGRWPRARRCWCRCPRRGYVPSLACARCRAPARCAHCAGPLGISPRPGPGRHADPGLPVVRAARRPPSTARTATAPSCAPPWWGSPARPRSWRGPSRGRRCAPPAARPGCSPRCRRGPSLVVATPGAEPVAEGGYGAALLLDSWALLGPGRPAGGRGDAAPLDERGGARAARRRPAGRSSSRPTPRIPSSRRWCAGTRRWLAERELADRRELGFPPVTRIAALSGSPAALAEFLEALRLPEDADLLGPGARAAAARAGGRAGALPGAGAARGGRRAGARARPRCRACAARRRCPSTCACSWTRSTSSDAASRVDHRHAARPSGVSDRVASTPMINCGGRRRSAAPPTIDR